MSLPEQNSVKDTDLGILRETRWLDVIGTGLMISFTSSGTRWETGPILTEKVLHGDVVGSQVLSEASGVCIATKIEGPSEEKEAILKIRMQIPPLANDPDPSKFKSDRASTWANHELDVLEDLTARGCSCTPKLLDQACVEQKETYPVPGGYLVFILMTKLPGRNLTNFHTLPLEKRDQVRIAFGKAIREFLAYGFDHLDPCRANILWDEKSRRCFIVDMEDAQYKDPPRQFVPRRDWGRWRLHRADAMYLDGTEDNDPMVPEGFDPCPDDETLYALEARAKEQKGTS